MCDKLGQTGNMDKPSVAVAFHTPLSKALDV
jgi:hypothetical protein